MSQLSPLTRRVVLLVVAAGLVLLSSSPAKADDWDTRTRGGTRIEVEHRGTGTSPGGGGGGSVPVYTNCVDTELTLTGVIPGIGAWIGHPGATVQPLPGTPIAYRTCTRVRMGCGSGG